MSKFKECRRTKEAHFQMNCVAMVVCLSYLAFALQMLASGFHATSKLVELRAYEVNATLEVQASAANRHLYFTDRLATLQSHQLRKVSFESHGACLRRGIQTADVYLLAAGFEYPEIRRQAIKWTEESCARLLFTPQVTTGPTLRQIVLEYWSSLEQFREDCIQSVVVLKQMAHYVWQRMASVCCNRDRSTISQRIHIDSYVREPRRNPLDRLPLPFGIRIKCFSSSMCHITYHRTPNTRPDLTPTAEDITRSAKKISTLLETKVALSIFGTILQVITINVIGAQIFFLYNYHCSSYRSDQGRQSHSHTLAELRCICNFYSETSRKFSYASRLQLGTSFSSAMTFVFLYSNVFMQFMLFLGTVCFAVGTTMLVHFFTASTSSSNIFHLVRGVNYFKHERDVVSTLEEGLVEDIPEDTLAESIEKLSRSAIFTEYQSDSDDDDEFVDLAGGITPTFTPVETDSEPGSEWPEVEA